MRPSWQLMALAVALAGAGLHLAVGSTASDPRGSAGLQPVGGPLAAGPRAAREASHLTGVATPDSTAGPARPRRRSAAEPSSERFSPTGAQRLGQHLGWTLDDRRIEALEAWWGQRPDLEAALVGEGPRRARLLRANAEFDFWRAQLLAQFGDEAAQRLAASVPLRRIDPDTGDLIRVDAYGDPLPFDPLQVAD